MKRFKISLPEKYRPVLNKVAKDLSVSRTKLCELIFIIYIKELHQEYWDEIKEMFIEK